MQLYTAISPCKRMMLSHSTKGCSYPFWSLSHLMWLDPPWWPILDWTWFITLFLQTFFRIKIAQTTDVNLHPQSNECETFHWHHNLFCFYPQELEGMTASAHVLTDMISTTRRFFNWRTALKHNLISTNLSLLKLGYKLDTSGFKSLTSPRTMSWPLLLNEPPFACCSLSQLLASENPLMQGSNMEVGVFSF